MIITENQLRHIVRKAILCENTSAQINSIDQMLNQKDAELESVMVSMLGQMDVAVDQDIQSGVLEDQKIGDEAVTVGTVVGFGLAIPLFLKIAGYAAKGLGNTLASMESLMGEDNLEGLGDEWAEWWFEWAEAAKQKKKKLMKAFAKKLLSIKYDEVTDKQVDFLSNVLWAVIYCYLGVEAGIHAWDAFSQPDFLSKVWGGFEGIMGAVKEGNAAQFIVEAIEAAGY